MAWKWYSVLSRLPEQSDAVSGQTQDKKKKHFEWNEKKQIRIQIYNWETFKELFLCCLFKFCCFNGVNNSSFFIYCKKCLLGFAIIVVYYAYTFANHTIQIHRRLRCFRYERFINFWLQFFDARRETILKSISWSYYTNNTQTLGTSRGPISISQHHGRTLTSQHYCWTQLLNFICLPQWQTTQLSAYMVQSQLPTDTFSKSSNSQDHRFRAWRRSRYSLISYLGFIMTIVIVISFVHERKLYPMLCTWTKRRIVQSSIKLNDNI